MKLEKVEKLLTSLASKQVPVSVMLTGQHGIGKSAVVRQTAEKIGYNFIDIRLSQRDAVDILGMPNTYNDPELGAVLEHHPPKWFLESLTKGNTVLFLDELNRARPDVLQAAFELVLDRRLNGRKLPSSVFIVAAVNPPDTRYDTVNLDEAMLDRFLHIHVQADHKSFMNWAKDRIHPDILGFLRTDKDALFIASKEDNKLPWNVTPSPRSYELMNHIYNLDLDADIKREATRGLIGDVTASQFYSYLDNQDNKPIKVADIIKWSEETETKLNSITSGDQIRLDLLNATIQEFMEKHEDKKVLAKAENFVKFFEKLPADLFYTTFIGLLDSNDWIEAIKKSKVLYEKSKEYEAVQNANLNIPGVTGQAKTGTSP